MVRKEVTINISNGLEVRPIAMLVQVASKFESTVSIEHEGSKVNAKSIMGLMTLVLDEGETVTVIAEGPDEKEALEGVTGFLLGK